MPAVNGGEDNARLIVSSNVVSCGHVSISLPKKIKRKRKHTLDPILPVASALKLIILPFLPSFKRTPLATSTTSTPAFEFTFSLSSSLPHSIPRCTRAQCTRCNVSSSGAPLVYDRSHRGHVRRIEPVSRQKCNCVSFFLGWVCFVVLDLDFDLGFRDERIRFGGGEVFLMCRWSVNGRFRGGDEERVD